jgi:integrase
VSSGKADVKIMKEAVERANLWGPQQAVHFSRHHALGCTHEWEGRPLRDERSVGAEFKVMQELMRHSSLRSTLNVYTQAVTPAKHEAQAAVLSLVFPS